MTALEQLETRIRALLEERARGTAFEAVVLRWLSSEPDLGLRAAWRWADWPERVRLGLPASDDGIDLVAEDADGAPVAVQVKFRSDPTRPITREEAQKALSFPQVFSRYLMVSNAWDRTRSATRGLAGEGRLSWALREGLERSVFDWLAALAGPVAPATRFTSRPHQRRAVEDAIAALSEPGRAQVRMACGTGKTLAALWVAEGLGIERGLVLAPTLLLLKQLRAEWLREAAEPFAALAVCSSDDVGEGGDAWELDPSDIPGEVTTDPERIAAFLGRRGRRIVFSTYQSSPRIAEAHADPEVPAFDLAVADEAHKVAGVGSARDGRTSAQRTILDAELIRAERRLFLTATPRVYGHGRRQQLEEDFGVEVASMDDEAVFGRVAHEFGFRAAVDAGILADYRLLVTIADDDAAASAIRQRAFVDVAGRPADADQVATAIAVRRAVEELGLRRVISFHSTVQRARTFAGLLPDVPLDGGAPEARWISGAQPVQDREVVLSELHHPAGSVVVSNARCLTEGIDVPALDAVVFADPRRSPIDLVQAIGRAMRSAPGKTTGWVIVPVHLGPGEFADPEGAVESSAFEPVIAVLRALRSHDPLLASDAARIRLSVGPRSAAGRLDGDLARVPLDLVAPAGLPVERLLDVIRLRAVDVSADPWSSGIAALRAYVEREGHDRVAVDVVENGFRVGGWVVQRRAEHGRGRLSQTRAAELEALPGWTWDPILDDWHAAIAKLRAFAAREGHARVPARSVEAGTPLGAWVSHQRARWRRGRLSADQIAEFEAVPGWSWEPYRDDWSAATAALLEFVAREGHSRVPRAHVEEGVRLGGWINERRAEWRAGRLSSERVAELEAIPGWIWDPADDDWAIAVTALRGFAAREGHGRVPRGHVEAGVKLGTWVTDRRSENRAGRMRAERVAELEAVPGWTWDPGADDWAAAVAAFRSFVDREGHARVPRGHVESCVRLGSWMAQRRADWRAGRLDAGRVAELEALPSWSWDPRGEDWAAALVALRTFTQREGHALVPSKHIEAGVRLGLWVANRRREHDRGVLSAARVTELEALQGWSWAPVADQWTSALAALHSFAEREGHARVPRDHVEAGVQLGGWVTARRAECKDGRLAADRAKELEDVPGWSWDPISDNWARAIDAYRAFAAREGHGRVPRSHVENGVRLGLWLSNRRRDRIRGKLSADRIAQLGSLPGWTW